MQTVGQRPTDTLTQTHRVITIPASPVGIFGISLGYLETKLALSGQKLDNPAHVTVKDTYPTTTQRRCRSADISNKVWTRKDCH